MINHGNLSPALHVRIILPTSKHRNARSPQGLMIQSQPCPSHLVQCPVSSNTFPFRDPRLPSLQSPTFGMLRATLQSLFPIADVPNFPVLTLIFCAVRAGIYHAIPHFFIHLAIAGARVLLYIGQIKSHADACSKMRLLLACRSHCIANFFTSAVHV